jgi:hypothetical protein
MEFGSETARQKTAGRCSERQQYTAFAEGERRDALFVGAIAKGFCSGGDPDSRL